MGAFFVGLGLRTATVCIHLNQGIERVISAAAARPDRSLTPL